MNKAEKAGAQFRAMDELASENSPLHQADAGCKLFLTIAYIILVVSFHKYDFTGLFPMVLFPVLGYQVAGVSVRTCFYKLRMVLPLVCAVGIFNPFFDHSVAFYLGRIPVTGGMVSMMTLMLKGIYTLMASFLLAATTRMESICGALRKFHCPRMITSLLLLTDRYVLVMLEEVEVMTTAYQLRAPGQKGIHISAWGSFLGQLLLRSMDRAQALYESMVVRGYRGEFPENTEKARRGAFLLVTVVVFVLMLLFRMVNVASLLGSWMVLHSA